MKKKHEVRPHVFFAACALRGIISFQMGKTDSEDEGGRTLNTMVWETEQNGNGR